DNESAAAELSTIQEMVKTIDEELVQRRADLGRLELIAPIDGTVLPPADSPPRPDASTSDQLANWTGSPFARKNIGATLSASTVFCEIGDPHRMQADIIIEQDDMEFVHPEQAVTIKLDALPHRTFHSTIEEISRNELK